MGCKLILFLTIKIEKLKSFTVEIYSISEKTCFEKSFIIVAYPFIKNNYSLEKIHKNPDCFCINLQI